MSDTSATAVLDPPVASNIPIPAPVKETQAQRVERLKRELNPWEAFDEIRRFAREGRGSIPPEWAGLRLKWWGIYTQGDGIGAIGGKGGVGVMSDYFMLRIAAPNGFLTARQMRGVASIAKTYARNQADITTRQNIQLHWLTVDMLPEVVDQLQALGLSPRGACGDVARNVTGCPLAGIDAEEVVDASPLAIAIAHHMVGNPDFVNLPRKFKTCITGCTNWCCYPEINDIAFTAVRRGGEIGYALRVGGGLAKEPFLAVKLNAFVRPDQVLEVTQTVAEIFRDQQVLRENREHARLKYLFMREGWTRDRFLSEIELRLGYKLDPAPEERIPANVMRDHAGVHAQKQPGLSYVGASLLRGRVTGDQLAAAADLAEEYGGERAQVRTTTMQNIVLVNIPTERTGDLVKELNTVGLHVNGSPFWRGVIACSGTEFCKLAISETKNYSVWLIQELEDRLPGFDQPIRISVTGCPNNCAQSWIADIGLEGKKVKRDGVMEDAFNFSLGGASGGRTSLTRPIGYRAPATEVPAAIERLLRGYLASRSEDEGLRAWLGRHDIPQLKAVLEGTN